MAGNTKGTRRTNGGARGSKPRRGLAGVLAHRGASQEGHAQHGFFKRSSVIEEERGPEAVKKPGKLKQLVYDWGGRLLGAAKDRTFSGQAAEYQAGRTSLDYMWNTAGVTSYGIVFPLLTIIVTQLVGVEQAGMFSLAYVAGMLLMILANFGVRTFQVSDIHEKHSFLDYQVNRWITCAAMLLVGWAVCRARGYSDDMFLMANCVFVYKMIDGLADVYEGRLQQMDKLYLAGVSQMIRSLAVLILFTVALFISRSLGIASTVMAIAAVASFVLVTLPLALLETPRSGRLSLAGVSDLFRQCAPLFCALFLYACIDNMPKFLMDGTLPYDNQLYFNAMYFPAEAILLISGFVYKPQLVRLSHAWVDPDRRKRFDLFIVVFLLGIALLTAVMAFLMNWIGVPVMSFLYGVDFEPFRNFALLMVVAGGIIAGIDFLYQVITIMRRQKSVTRIYLVVFVLAILIPYMLIRMSGLRGAVLGYLIVMTILFAMLLMEYVSVRLLYRKHPEDDPAYAELQATLAARQAAEAAPGARARKAPTARTAQGAPKGARAAGTAAAGRGATEPGQRTSRAAAARARAERAEAASAPSRTRIVPATGADARVRPGDVRQSDDPAER